VLRYTLFFLDGYRVFMNMETNPKDMKLPTPMMFFLDPVCLHCFDRISSQITEVSSYYHIVGVVSSFKLDQFNVVCIQRDYIGLTISVYDGQVTWYDLLPNQLGGNILGERRTDHNGRSTDNTSRIFLIEGDGSDIFTRLLVVVLDDFELW
jgi:hypothetical protein